MKKTLHVFAEITHDALCCCTYFIKNNLLTFANILNLIIPYVMYFVGQYAAINRNDITVGWELFIPLVFVVIIYYLKSTANKIGKGSTIPVHEQRFTRVDDDGEVSVEYDRIQELILYVADLEDWMERKGML